MWFAGLRGAMAYALALEASGEFPQPAGDCILANTLVYSLITVLGLGTFLNPVLTWADVMRKPEPLGEVEKTDNCSNRMKKSLGLFDTDYFAPLFIKEHRLIELRNQERTESFAGSDTLA